MQGGFGITVDGDGTQGRPYKISTTSDLIINAIADTPTVNLVMSNHVLSANATVSLDELTNVTTAGLASLGDVLGYVGNGRWEPVAPSQATVGSVVSGNCLSGQGTTGSPLMIDLAGGEPGLVCDGAGLHLPYESGWNAQWTAEGNNPVHGSSSIDTGYLRWAGMCFLRWQFEGGAGFAGGTGNYHWTAPFPAAGPTQVQLPGTVRLANNETYFALATILAGSTDITLRVPQDRTSNVTHPMRNADMNNNVAGTGYPQIAGLRPLDATPTSHISFAGWYKIAAGA